MQANLFAVGVDSLREVLEEVASVSHKWYNVGLQLGLPSGTLETIKYQYSDAPTCMREMLIHWLKGTDPPPTWEALADALESRTVDEAQLAQQLRSKYCALVPRK